MPMGNRKQPDDPGPEPPLDPAEDGDPAHATGQDEAPQEGEQVDPGDPPEIPDVPGDVVFGTPETEE